MCRACWFASGRAARRDFPPLPAPALGAPGRGRGCPAASRLPPSGRGVGGGRPKGAGRGVRAAGRLQEGREQGEPHAQLGTEGRHLPHPAVSQTDAALTWQLWRQRREARPPRGGPSRWWEAGPRRLGGAGWRTLGELHPRKAWQPLPCPGGSAIPRRRSESPSWQQEGGARSAIPGDTDHEPAPGVWPTGRPPRSRLSRRDESDAHLPFPPFAP